MQEELTYEQAIGRAEELVAQIEKSELPLDQIADKLQEANKLLEFCRNRLYEVEKSCESLLNDNKNV